MARTLAAFATDTVGSDAQDIRVDRIGNLLVVDGLEDVRQRVLMRLRWWIGQWFLQVRDGVPYRPEIFQRSTSVGLAAAVVSDQIKRVPGVTSVRNVIASIDPVSRLMQYSATIDTAFGTIQMDETVG